MESIVQPLRNNIACLDGIQNPITHFKMSINRIDESKICLHLIFLNTETHL